MPETKARGDGPQPSLFDTGASLAAMSPMLTPKRPRTETAGLADVFPYYAGFSYEWARGELAVDIPIDSVVLDPWNGSGTTTLAAQSLGLQAVGVDLNPVANAVAALRAAPWDRVAKPLSPPPFSRAADTVGDALSAWFADVPTKRLREWVLHLQGLPREETAFGLVSLFRVTRALTAEFEGSNPTWVRRSKGDQGLIDVPADEIDRLLHEDQLALASRVKSDGAATASGPMLITADSTALPLKRESVDRILTSPPYLTRIDYAVAYSRELALIGINIAKDRTLREALMGTTLIRANQVAPVGLGPIAQGLLDDIEGHSSKASRGYYLKQARQYLADLCSSFSEMNRVLKPAGKATLVVQDSFYKDVHLRLADICEEVGQQFGWDQIERREFRVKRTLTMVNKAAKQYKKGTVNETVLVFKKRQRS